MCVRISEELLNVIDQRVLTSFTVISIRHLCLVKLDHIKDI